MELNSGLLSLMDLCDKNERKNDSEWHTNARWGVTPSSFSTNETTNIPSYKHTYILIQTYMYAILEHHHPSKASQDKVYIKIKTDRKSGSLSHLQGVSSSSK